MSPAPARTAAPTNTGAPIFTSTSVYTSTASPPITDSASTPIASPTPVGGSGKIVFVSCDYKTVSQDGLVFERTDDDSCEIYVMSADGSDPTQIMISGGNSNPVWSPDGTRIMYARNRGIVTIYPDGSGQTTVTETKSQHLHPDWSPDGKVIVFQSDEGQSVVSEFDIYIVNADGTSLKRLTHNRNSSSPAWLPFSSKPLVSHPDCSAGWSRLKVGDQAKVLQETDTPNRVRTSPGTSEEITALLHPGTVMKVIEGPVCVDGLIFWKVENKSIPGRTGWSRTCRKFSQVSGHAGKTLEMLHAAGQVVLWDPKGERILAKEP